MKYKPLKQNWRLEFYKTDDVKNPRILVFNNRKHEEAVHMATQIMNLLTEFDYCHVCLSVFDVSNKFYGQNVSLIKIERGY